MFRKAVTFIVMLGFITGQLAAIPHLHADRLTPLDHDFRPHIHVSWFAHSGQSQERGHRHHHDADDAHSHCVVFETEADNDCHDNDAVYLPNDIRDSMRAQTVTPLDHCQLMTALHLAVIDSTAGMTSCLDAPIFPGECRHSEPLYLALRALRI